MSYNVCYAVYYPRLDSYLTRNRRLTRDPAKANRFLVAQAAYEFASIDTACGIAKVREVY